MAVTASFYATAATVADATLSMVNVINTVREKFPVFKVIAMFCTPEMRKASRFDQQGTIVQIVTGIFEMPGKKDMDALISWFQTNSTGDGNLSLVKD